jgi:transposase-like protein
MDTKLKMIKEYLDEQVPMTKLVKKYSYDLAKLKYLVKLYQMHGEKPFSSRQKNLYPRGKARAIKIVMSNQKSARQLALEKACRVRMMKNIKTPINNSECYIFF